MKGDISPDLDAGTLLFSGYDDDYLKINDTRYESGLGIHGGEVVVPWGPDRLNALAEEHLACFLAEPPEVLLLGTGRLTQFPSADIMALLASHHIGFECMDSRAAARTYNILIGEGRRVSAAMLLPGVRK